MKRVQIDSHIIIFPEVFTLGHMGADLARLIMADECDLQILVVIGEIRRSGLRDRSAVPRLALAWMGS